MLKIYHIRNATMVIETQNDVILIDPMLGKKGTIQSFTYLKFKPKRNPIVDLPKHSFNILNKVTHCLITHRHPDHLDKAGIKFLISKNIPITCSYKDASVLKKLKLNVVQELKYLKKSPFLSGSIEGIPARHGYDLMAKMMGNVMGFFIKLPHQKSIYISADTIYTPEVDRVLKNLLPEISVLACGTAQMDLLKPILMTKEDIIKFVKNAPKKVIANHMEALNHCPLTRKKLFSELEKNQLSGKVIIPEDGETLLF